MSRKNTLHYAYFHDQMFYLEYKIYDHWIEFKVYDIEGYIDDDRLPLKEKYEVSEESFLDGSLKWDGCCNWTANAHFCGKIGFQNLVVVMDRLYEVKSKEWSHGD